jgi:XTP/dITP diphosphohydrolase
MTQRLVLASNNRAKLAELQRLFEPLGLELVGQGALGIPEAEEPHATFLENALAKARHAAAASGLPALADDSGLCVDALGGQPGVASAHYAEVDLPVDADRETRRALQDAANNQRLLEALQGVADRRAGFVCTLVALHHAADPQPLVATGAWRGEILEAARGAGGFGYDPLLWIPSLSRSVAELNADEKNALSHRALAVHEMLARLRALWIA